MIAAPLDATLLDGDVVRRGIQGRRRRAGDLAGGVPQARRDARAAVGARARATRTVLMLVEARRARPYLQPGDVIVLDNLRAHKHPRVRRIIARGGARVRCWRSAVDPPN
jgi:hypothetical protein